MVILLDTSAINRLHDDSSRDSIVAALKAGHVVRVSALNVLEAGRTRDIDRRRSLLRLLKQMTGDERPLEMPNVLACRAMSAYGQRASSLDYSIDRDADILWQVLVDPVALDEQARRDFDAIHASIEEDLRLCHERARPHFQKIFRNGVVPPLRASSLLRAYMSRPKFLHAVLNDLYHGTVGVDLRIDELSLLFRTVPEVAGFMLGWGHSVHQRAIAREHYGSRNAGMVDLWFATYLGRVDCFVTADDNQYRALRLVARIMAPRCSVLRYQSFQKAAVGRL